MRKHPYIPNLYVSEDGRIFKEIGTVKGYGGYHYVNVSANGGRGTRRHVLVAETYLGPRPEGAGVRHLNGTAGDDRPENLAWGTQAENMRDMVDHGTSTHGKKNPMAKIGEDQVMEIRNRWASGESPTLLAQEFGLTQSGVQDIIRGRTWQRLPLTRRGF